MGKVGAKAAIGDGAGDGVATDTGGFFKDVATGGDSIRGMGGLFFGGYPFTELLGRIDVDTQEHFGVLRAAILGTLADVHADFVRLDPNGVDAIGDEVGFAGELRNPKAVISIGGNECDEGGCAKRRITYRDMELVGGDDAKRRVAELPPELVTYSGDFDFAWGRHPLLNGMDDPGGGEEQY